MKSVLRMQETRVLLRICVFSPFCITLFPFSLYLYISVYMHQVYIHTNRSRKSHHQISLSPTKHRPTFRSGHFSMFFKSPIDPLKMASFTPLWLLPLILLSIFGAAAGDGEPSAAFVLSSVSHKSRGKTATFRSSLSRDSRSAADLRSGKGQPPPPHKKPRAPPPPHKKPRAPPPPHNYTVKYTMALIITLRIGTPPQNQRMMLDTGSQLMWMPCLDNTTKAPPPPVGHTHTAPYNISRSDTISFFPCKKSCQPNIFRQGVDNYCNDDNTKCKYSSIYADGTVVEGTLVKENISLANSFSPLDSPTFLMGCAMGATDPEGILGMNSGDFSFISQSKYQTFSYCVPVRRKVNASRRNPDGAFYLGANPNSGTFNYAKLLSFADVTIHPAALDTLNYVVNMTGVRIGGVKLDIPAAYFRFNERYEGLTIIDSGTEYTFLVRNVSDIIKKEVALRAGKKFKTGYVYRGAMEMCFDGSAAAIGKMVGNMSLEFDNGVEIFIPADRIADDITENVSCLGIGTSDLLPDDRNIIGNFHTQNLWVEFDLNRRRVGFGKADCSRALV
ncbi:unnamed protein product [Cuscuta europaea]|uniref:Peptidase A1 domain-containing protein n=1 Tax=Cuscuta europaea TaxID=41803 RepID=A0A9P0ZLB8_CUSEU|nr:unnamed protein product [Cuscuta europaea]